MPRPRLTLAQAFALSLVALALLLSALFYVFMAGSRRSILVSSERLRDEKSRALVERVDAYLSRAQGALEDVEGRLGAGAVRADDLPGLEAALFSVLAHNPNLAEVTFTRAERTGFDEGVARLAERGRRQLSLYRPPAAGPDVLISRHDYQEKGAFVSDLRLRPAGAGVFDTPWQRRGERAVADPTEHLTFQAAARERNRGSPLWSDLHFSQLDAHLPEGGRRVVVTVQKAVEDRAGALLGVLRVGLLTRNLDAIAGLGGADEAHRVFLCDREGRLITRLSPADVVIESGDDLRVRPADPPPDVVAALRLPALAGVGETAPMASGEVAAGGRRFLVTFRALPRTQDWVVGVVAPEDFYLGDLERARRAVLLYALALMAAILVGGTLTLRAVQRGLAGVVASTARMRDFDFRPSETRAPFRDVQSVMERLELAKTALRAMGKYVPLDLVRLLYQANREPTLGGELQRVSLMFTDIKDFTTYSEQLGPNELARALGRYLDVMTRAVHRTQGIIDKYIGDAVMAAWNVPTPAERHAALACEAALACREATLALFASPEWAGLPPFYTRFGVHTDEVMVGHFGSPDRMSFTALGDGVNLASRLEAINKQYGTSIIVSEAVRDEAGDAFRFRALDRVAVKGKTRGVLLYELVGRAGQQPQGEAERLDAYERALEAYWSRDFAAASALLEPQADLDPPSAVLLERCRRLAQDPPPPDWNGVFVSTSK